MTTPTLNGTRMLIVEDNFVVADALRFMLTGYDGVVTAIVPSRELALASLAIDPVDVVILDINLNGTSVVPLAEHLRRLGIPFVFLSGYCDEELLPEHLRAHPRLDKPVEAERLVRAMLHLTRRLPS
jgi:two-component SAPR family response regulator